MSTKCMIIKGLRWIISLLIMTVGLPMYLMIGLAFLLCEVMGSEPNLEWLKDVMSTPFRYLLFRD